MTAELWLSGPGKSLALYGPMRLLTIVENRFGPDDELALDAGRYAFKLLDRLAPAPALLKRRPGASLEPNFAEPLFNAMISAVKAVDQTDLWPLAAVAGTVAQAVAEYLEKAGAVKAIVDNGGDVAVFLAHGQTTEIGVRVSLKDPAPAYKVSLSGEVRPFWGLCSSGLGGRSLTQGIVDTAMCIGDSAAIADAAATAVANASLMESNKIRRLPAERLRPETDIPGLMVTSAVAPLTDEEVDRALEKAIILAQSLVDRGVVFGALAALNGKLSITRDFNHSAAPLTSLPPTVG
ncbi:MAG: hypothetical protein LBT62_05635 [Deltaproteobacteria bacterium]|jgi:ApbE superfamily uncharacterized protein (UPF0280 family)|nr:hypothetical protein [Deltaproteobacteria bacterium]